MNKKIVVLYSGGLDSYILYHMAKTDNPDAEIEAVYWEHGHLATKAELAALPEFVKVKHVDWLQTIDDGYKSVDGSPAGNIYIPGRNLVFSILEGCISLPDEIWVGAVAEENSPSDVDKNDEFVHYTTELLSYVLRPFKPDGVRVRTPFVERDMTKKDTIYWALKNNITPEELMSTNSCFQMEDETNTVACGNCRKCLQRWAIFNHYGFSEKYLQNPIDAPECRRWLSESVDKLDACNWENRRIRDDFNWEYLIRYVTRHIDHYKTDEEMMKIYNSAKNNY